MTMPGTDPPPHPRKGKRPPLGAADKTSPKAIERNERNAKAIELRISGKSWTQIASECEFYDAAHAYKTVSVELAKVTREPAQQLVNLYVARLETLLEKAWTDAMSGNVEALRECRANVMDTAKLLGLVKQKVDVEVSPPREQMWDRVRAWVSDPTPELEEVLRAAGWERTRLPVIDAEGVAANDAILGAGNGDTE